MKFTKPKISLLICSTAIATLLTGCGGDGEQIPIHPRLPAAFQRSKPAFQLLIDRASHWEIRVQALPEGQELVRTASPQKGTGWGTTGQALPVQLPTSPSGQWEIGVRLFDRKENGQVRGFAVLEGKKKVSKGELAPQKPIEVFLHYREPSKE